MLTGSAEKLMVVLRDGRKLVGVLRSWDQFGWSYLEARAYSQANLSPSKHCSAVDNRAPLRAPHVTVDAWSVR